MEIKIFQRTSSTQPQSQLSGWAGVVLDKVQDALGDRLSREVASFLNFFGDLPRNVIGPMLRRVEGHHPKRLVELPGHQIGNYGLKVRTFDIGLAVGGAFAPKLSITR